MKFIKKLLFNIALLFAIYIIALRWLVPLTTPYMYSEFRRLGDIKAEWVDIETLPDFVPASLVAAEDSQFCTHQGFDIAAIRDALKAGGRRGGSTISQQTAKNLFLWQGRSWVRKALEVPLTLTIELVYPKRRILELYMNIIEYDTGVFGIEAAAYHHFHHSAAELTPREVALLAAVLPNPKGLEAVNPTSRTLKRAKQIENGANTLLVTDGSDCFVVKAEKN